MATRKGKNPNSKLSKTAKWKKLGIEKKTKHLKNKKSKLKQINTNKTNNPKSNTQKTKKI